MNKDLEKIAKDYIEVASSVGNLMLKGLNLKSRDDLRSYRVLHPMGEFDLNGQNKYVFHGRGCRFSNKDINIDWDFGYDDKWCGINPWLFAEYIKEYKKSLFEFYDGANIHKEFEKAVNEGEMMKKYDLYYFK